MWNNLVTFSVINCAAILQINDHSNSFLTLIEVETNPSIWDVKASILAVTSFTDSREFGLLYAGKLIEEHTDYVSENTTCFSDLGISTGNEEELTIIQLLNKIPIHAVYSKICGETRTAHLSLTMHDSLQQLLDKLKTNLEICPTALQFNVPLHGVRCNGKRSLETGSSLAVPMLGLYPAEQAHIIEVECGRYQKWCRIRSRNASIEIIEGGIDANKYVVALFRVNFS